MGNRAFCMAAGTVFTLVSIAHLLRILSSASIQVDGASIPMAASWVAVVVTGTLAIWAFRSARGQGAS